MNWETFVDPVFHARLCTTLLHSVWQVAVLAVVAWGLARLRGRRSVEWSYALHVAAMIAGIAAVPITYVLVDVDLSRAAQGETGPETASRTWTPAALALDETPPAGVEVEQPANPGNRSAASDVGASAPVAAGYQEPSPKWPQMSSWAAGLYAIGVLVMLARFMVGIWHANRLCARARVIRHGLLYDLLSSLARRCSMRVVPVLARTKKIMTPKVVGVVRPTILLPASAITGLSSGELEMILAHELAHVRRFDMWVNLVQRLAEVVLFFNPALWYLSRRISTLREYCCDELACRAMSQSAVEPRTEYASALVRVVELERRALAKDGHSPVLKTGDLAALGASERSPSELRRRVARLFGEPLSEPVRLSRGGLLALAILAAVLFAAPTAWQSAADSAASRPEETSQPDDRAGSAASARVADKREPDSESEGVPVDLAIVVARHVLLLDGKEIITWAELEERIAALPNPALARPSFYITRGADEAGLYRPAKDEIWRLHRKFHLAGHSEGSLWPRSDLRYDRIETADDLVPDEALRAEGRVIDGQGEPVIGAEVLLVTPVDESIS
jgi:beta-lactamase regulating signal transducer with metallopeptidase domain